MISLLASYFYAKRITKPILQISEKAERMQMLQLNIACDLNTKDELGDLSRNIDSLYRSLCMNIETLQSEMHKISQMEKSKTDFMRAASHELKTPIAALNGMLEGMIDNIGVYKDKEKYLKESQSLIQKLGGLVNEILFATKLDEIGQEEIQEEINIGSLIKEILQNHQFMIREKELYIQYPMEKLRYICNQKAFRVVLSNVISNAVSYTHKGGTIAIFYECQENTRILSIENQCDPIAEDDLEKIFEPFFTLEYSRDKKKSGTGLGLYIVKKNLEAMGMKYAFRNIENGVKFEIFLESPC